MTMPQDAPAGGRPSPIQDLLKKVSFFQRLSDQELADVASCMALRTFEPGNVIFRKDEPGTSLFIIASGAVKISIPAEGGEEAPLALLKTGDYFGELSLLDGGAHTATASAMARTATLTLERDDFLKFVTSNSNAAGAVLSAMAALIRRQNSQLFSKFFDE